MYVSFTKSPRAVNWFPFLNWFLKTVSRNQFFNFCRTTVPDFRPQKWNWKLLCAVVNWIYYRTFEGIFMSQIMSVFFTNSEYLLHNFKRTNIHDFLHLNVYILQTSNMYWDRIILFKEFLTSQFFVAVY